MTYFNRVKRLQPSPENRAKLTRLDKNERVSKLPQIFLKLFKDQLTSEKFSTYPEIFSFYETLSKIHKKNKNCFFATAGIDTGLKNSIELFGNKKIIILDPTFAMINIYCKVFNKKIIKVSYDKKLKIEFEKLIKTINNKVSLIILSNPNSPTGTILNTNQIKKILDKAKRNNIMVVIDEAYYGFSKVTSMNLLNRYKNLIILRTFSKAYGIAGLRVGYVISNPKIIKKFNNIRPMYEINSLGILAANILMKNQFIKENYLDEVENGKKFLINFFKKKKIEYLNSEGNFILFKLKKKKNFLFKKLTQKKIKIVEKINFKHLKGYSRITLAPKNEISKFIKIINKY